MLIKIKNRSIVHSNNDILPNNNPLLLNLIYSLKYVGNDFLNQSIKFIHINNFYCAVKSVDDFIYVNYEVFESYVNNDNEITKGLEIELDEYIKSFY